MNLINWTASQIMMAAMSYKYQQDQRHVIKGVGPLVDDQRIYRSLRELLGQFSSVVQRPYSQSVWVYACINVIAQNIARVPFVLKKDAGALEPDRIESGELYELFQNPNPLMTLEQLIEATWIFYGLRGECLWILEGRENITQIPKEIWCFDPANFDPIQDKKSGWLLGWQYKGKDGTFFPARDVLQFKAFNPYDPFRGLTPLEAAKLSVESDYSATLYNKVFFENGAVTSLNISVPETLDDDAYNRLVKQFEDRHKGAKKAHRIAIAEGGAKITESRIGQRDMEFINGKHMSREEIFGAYNVNEVVLGIFKDVKSEEGVKSAHKSFWEECLMPKITYFEGVLWAKFFSKIGQRRGKGRIWGQHDLATVGALQTNYADNVTTAHKMWVMGWPINMINKRLGLGMPDVAWGNEWWVPGGYAPVTALDSNTPTSTEPKQLVGPLIPIMSLLTAKKEATVIPMIENNEKGGYVVDCADVEHEFKGKIKTFIFMQRKKVLESIQSQKPEIVLQNYDKLRMELGSIYQRAIMSGQKSVMREIDDTKTTVLPIFINDNFICTHVDNVLNSLQNISNMLVQAVARIREEKTTDEVLAKVREIYNYIAHKGNMLSTDEVKAAYEYGREIESRRFVQLLNS